MGYIDRNYNTMYRTMKMIRKNAIANWNHAEKMIKQMLYRETKNAKADSDF